MPIRAAVFRGLAMTELIVGNTRECVLDPNLLAWNTDLQEMLATELFSLFGTFYQHDDVFWVYLCNSEATQVGVLEAYGSETRDNPVLRFSKVSADGSNLLRKVRLLLDKSPQEPACSFEVCFFPDLDDDLAAVGVSLVDHDTSFMIVMLPKGIATNLSENIIRLSVGGLARKMEHFIVGSAFERHESAYAELSNLDTVSNVDELSEAISKKIAASIRFDYLEVRVDSLGQSSKRKVVPSGNPSLTIDLEIFSELIAFCQRNKTWIWIEDASSGLYRTGTPAVIPDLENLRSFESIFVVNLDGRVASTAGTILLASHAKFVYTEQILAQLFQITSRASSTLRRLEQERVIAANWAFSAELAGKTSLEALLSKSPDALKILADADEVVLILQSDAFIERPQGISGMTLMFANVTESVADPIGWRTYLEKVARIGDPLGDATNIADELHFVLSSGTPIGLLVLIKRVGPYFLDEIRIALNGAASHFGATLALISAAQLELSKDILRKEYDAFFASIAINISELVWAVDAKGRIAWASPNHEEFIGRSGDSIVGLDLGEIVSFYAGDDVSIESWFFRTDANILFEIVDKDGKTHVLEAATSELPAVHSSGAKMVISARDITDKITMARDLEESESRYRSIVEASGQGIWMLDLGGTIQFANKAMGELLGIDPANMTSRDVSDFVEPSENGQVGSLFVDSFDLPEVQRELLLVHNDGSLIHGLAKVSIIRDTSGKALSRLAVIADISRHKAAEYELEARLERDPLTGLLNRIGAEKYFLDLVQDLEPNTLVAMFFLDLDRFKLINDTRGHMIGDKLLLSVAARLNVASRTRDVVARLGGDEFLVVASGFHDAEAAETFGKRIAANFARPFVIEGEDYYTTASIGIATASLDANWSELLRDADTAMYRAKESRSSKVTSFDQSFRSQVERRMLVEGELRQAVVRNEVRMVFQPIIDISNATVVGLESLMRWESSKLGSMSPIEFIPVAEDSGLIQPLGGFAINSSTRSYRELTRQRPTSDIFVAVNVSMRQLETLHRESFMEIIKSADLGHGRLILEITESEMMRYPEDFGSLFRELQELGVRIAIDDFGTGYSSLSQLSALAPDIVKIDKHFIANLHTDQSRQIVSAVVAMCDALGVYTVAEGVETENQLEILASIGCHFAQGFFIAKPLEVAQLPVELSVLEARLEAMMVRPGW